MDDSELDSFKRVIDLRAYAESLGYLVDKAESWKGETIMRNASDKIAVRFSHRDDHWVYWSCRGDSADQGTILQFALRRLGCNLGELRKRLRSWTGQVGSWQPALAKDLARVARAWAVMGPIPPHPYLEQRSISAGVLSSKRFSGCVRMARNGVAAFPHFDGDGICGMEFSFRGPEVKRFITGGRKGLWMSNKFSGDDALLFFESGVEGLSYATLSADPDDRVRYASTAGGFGEGRQSEVIAAAILDMPDGADIVVSMNADDGGKLHAGKLREIFSRLPSGDRRFVEHYPQGHTDWNDMLCAIS
jgi:hypothetical protein